jgi:endonuclease YncB( thermonuclease family)
VVKAIDGDTVKLDVQIWIDLTQRFSLRLYGVNAPGKKDNGVPECEKKHGQESASFLGRSNPK